MAMHFEGRLAIAAPRDRVWAFIVDPQAVSKCLPDVQRLEVLEEQAARIRAERALLGRALAALTGVTVYPSEANFFLVRVSDAARCDEALRRQGVLVRSLHGAHPLLANCLRVTVGTPEENRILLTAFREVLR